MTTPSIPKKSFLVILLTATLLFIFLLPISANINFMQNDDWVYYRQVGEFLKGNFVLHRYIETTFYTQGLMGAGFAKIFGIAKLPVLTLIVSVLNYFIFTFIIRRFYLKNTFDSVIAGLIFFWSPLHIYSILGFMSENYFIFFTLLTFLFAQYFLEKYGWKYLVLFNLVLVLGFFSKQLIVVSAVALILHLLISKKLVAAATQFVFTATLLGYYFWLFPLTSEMKSYQAFDFVNLLNVQKTYNNIYIYLMYGLFFMLPFVGLLISTTFKNTPYPKTKLAKIALALFCVSISFVVTTKLFTPQQTSKTTMYYNESGLTNNGFFSGSTIGGKNKYTIKFGDGVYKTWDTLARIGLAIAVVALVFLNIKMLNYYSIYTIIYTGFMCIMQVVYDRYLMILTPVLILCVIGISKITKFTVSQRVINIAFLLLIVVYSYNYMMDFFLINWNMWHKANLLTERRGIRPERISAGYAWQKTHKNLKNDWRYIFSFENKTQNPFYTNYTVIDTITPNYPLNIFNQPIMYLYRKNF